MQIVNGKNHRGEISAQVKVDIRGAMPDTGGTKRGAKMAERATFKGVANLIIKQGDRILLFYRTDGFFKGGWWVLPAGHIEQGETAMDAALREAKEELGIGIRPSGAEFAHVVSNLASGTEAFDFFFIIKNYSGQIRNCEGDKCAEMKYFSPEEIKGLKNIATTTRLALSAIGDGMKYSECRAYGGTDGN
ncbi:MAG: NUDIX domain-containing protein [Rickettsiales bacterium]|jgi:8-oxo-dGTP pyrophosphatase MutT (NUDIX family)|nr:NUDIX domain-containing protein [Rickettsiales bacterium]